MLSQEGCVVFWNVLPEDRATYLSEIAQFEVDPMEHEQVSPIRSHTLFAAAVLLTVKAYF